MTEEPYHLMRLNMGHGTFGNCASCFFLSVQMDCLRFGTGRREETEPGILRVPLKCSLKSKCSQGQSLRL